jgi:hypothetical protein
MRAYWVRQCWQARSGQEMSTLSKQLEDCCTELLDSPIERVLFEEGHLSAVAGLVLRDGREVVLKLRPYAQRVFARVEVQRLLHARGFPCPEPIAGPLAWRGLVASAETLVRGGTQLQGPHTAEPYAQQLERMIRLAPMPQDVGSLLPQPPWAGWDHAEAGIWPVPDDLDADLNADHEVPWLDEVAQQVRDCLRRARLPVVVVAEPALGVHHIACRPRLGQCGGAARSGHRVCLMTSITGSCSAGRLNSMDSKSSSTSPVCPAGK